MSRESEESIFTKAIELPQEAVGEFLDEACSSDSELRARIAALVAAHHETENFIDDIVQANGQRATAAHFENVSGKRIANYRLLQKIGEGGFGVVYMAEQESPVCRKVAVKIIKPGMDTAAVVARFEAERQALAMMEHPNIARVFDGGSFSDDAGINQRPYFVMELVKGVPVTEYCDKNALTTADRLRLFQTVCGAVQHAHQKGIIHRDIKPFNVMVTLHDGEPVVKVIDFGVAKAIHQRLTEKTMFTQYGQMIGTPQYMSPEQAEMSGLDVDTRSDIYSLGVLLYELLTGCTPLDSNQLRTAGYREMQRMICEQEPAKPSDRVSTAGKELTVIAKHRSADSDRLHREIKGDLDWVVMKAIEKDRRRRYETASEFSADIGRFLNEEAIDARPPSLVYRLSKVVRRNRVPVAVGSLVLMTLIVASIVTSIGMFRARRAERKTNEQVVLLEQETNKLNQANESNKKLAESARLNAELATANEAEARRLAIQSNSLRLATIASGIGAANPGLGLALAVTAAEQAVERNSFHNTTILNALRQNRELKSLELSQLLPNSPRASGVFQIGNSESVLIQLTSSTPCAIALNLKTGNEDFRINSPRPFSFTAINPQRTLLATAIFGYARGTYKDGLKKAYTGMAVRLWDLESGVEKQVLRGHEDQVVTMDFSRNGKLIATGAYDGTVRIWDVETGNLLQVFEDEDNQSEVDLPVVSVQFSSDGSRILAVDGSQPITAGFPSWDGYEMDPANPKDVDVASGTVSAGISSSSRNSARPTVRLWDLESEELVAKKVYESRGSSQLSAGFLPGGKDYVLFSRRFNGARTWDEIVVFDTDNGTERTTIKSTLDSTEFNLDGRTIFFRRYQAEILAWEKLADKNAEFVFSQPTPHFPSGDNHLSSLQGDTKGILGVHEGQPFEINYLGRTEVDSIAVVGAEPVSKFQLLGHDYPVGGATVMSDGRLVTCDESLVAKVWSLADEVQVPIKLQYKDKTIKTRFATYCGDGTRIATSAGGKFRTVATSQDYGNHSFNHMDQVYIWKLEDEPVRFSFKPHLSLGDWRFRAGFTQLQGLMSIVTNEERKIGRRFGNLIHCEVSRNGKRLLTVHNDLNIVEDFESPVTSHPQYQPVRVWDLETGRFLFGLNGFRNTVNYATFNPEGDQIATLESGRQNLVTEHGGSTNSDSRDHFGQVDIWEGNSGEHQHTLLTSEDIQETPGFIHWHPTGKYLLCNPDYDNRESGGWAAVVYSTTTGEIEREFEGRTSAYLDVSPDGRFVAGAQGNGLRIWNFKTGESVHKFVAPKGHWISSMDFSPDSKTVLATFSDGTAQTWNTVSGEPVCDFQGHLRSINMGRFSPDGRWIATAASDGTARVWDAHRGAEWMKISLGQEKQLEVLSAKFSPDGESILTVDEKGNTNLWPVDPLKSGRISIPAELTPVEHSRFQVELFSGAQSLKEN